MIDNQSKWAISSEEFSLHIVQFNNLNPNNGFINGSNAKTHFAKSKLSNSILGKIWFLSDYDQDGLMSLHEFSIAMHLIKRRLEGFELPSALPKEIHVSTNFPFQENNPPNCAIPSYSELMAKAGVEHSSVQMKTSLDPESPQMPIHPKHTSSPPIEDWTMPHSVKPRYRLQFNQRDRQKKGHLSGDDAKAVLIQSGLSNSILAQIWFLSDADGDGKLTCDEFCVAMYLVEQARAGRTLPLLLPDSFLPQPATAIGQRSPPTNEAPTDHSNNNDTEQLELHTVSCELETEERPVMDVENVRVQEAIKDRNEEKELLKKMKERKEYLLEVLATEEKKCQQFQFKLKDSMELLEPHNAEIELMRLERNKLVDTTFCLHEELEAAKDEHSRCKKDKTSLQETVSLEINNNYLNNNIITEIEKEKQSRKLSISNLQREITELQDSINLKTEDVALTTSILHDIKLRANRQKVQEIQRLKSGVEIKRKEVTDIVGKHQQYLRPYGVDGVCADLIEPGTKSMSLELWRCIALNDFKGRQTDELTFRTNDIIMVQSNPPVSIVTGWLYGRLESNEFYGVFPEMYVKKIGNDDNKVLESVSQLENGNNREQTVFQQSVSHDSSIKKATSNMWVEAIFPWMMDIKNKTEGQLSFQVGQRIRVLEECFEDWWKGEIHTYTEDNEEIYIVGLFPKVYVRPINCSDNDTMICDSMNESMTKYSNLNFGASNDISDANIIPGVRSFSSSSGGEYCLALYPYESSVPGDLTMRPGDVIQLIDTGANWWKGHIRGVNETGLFPSHYVKKLTNEELEDSGACNTLLSQYYTPLTTDSGNFSSMTYDYIDRIRTNQAEHSRNDQRISEASRYCTLEDTLAHSSSSTSTTIATVVSGYIASTNEELTCVSGQTVTVIDTSLSGWYKIEISVNGLLKSGLVPRNCISLHTSGADAASNGEEANDPMTESGYERCLTMAPSELPYDGFRVGDRILSVYQYSAQNADELTFDKNSVIELLSKDEPEWWRGRIVSSGMVGLFPVNYVRRPRSDCQMDKELLALGAPVVSGVRNTVSNDVIDPSLSGYINDNARFNAILTEDEKRRQFYILELIDTEKSYHDDLQEMHKVLYEPISKANLITAKELKLIFINWTELVPKSYNFYMALKIRKDNCGFRQPIQCIGDILLSNFPNFIAYVRFCSLQNQAISFLEKKKKVNPKFKEFCLRCEENLRCKNMPLTSYFLKPMQRITKYKLIVENIFKYTEDSHPDRGDMEEAVAAARSLCEAVNEGIREKENAERLEWIQDHVNCDGLNDKLYFNSTTNSLGHRKLIYSGSLSKAKSGKELVGFLFNDFLLLATPSYNTGGCPFVFPLETSSTSKMLFKMYMKPILLNKILVMTGCPSSHHSIYVTSSSNVFNGPSNNELFFIKVGAVDCVLKALSINDRDKWVERLVAASLQYMEIDDNIRQVSMSVRRCDGVGRLLVTVLEAVNLKNCAVSENKTNAYCEASLGNQVQQSKVVSSTYNPKWNCHMQFLIKNIERDVLCVTVYDKDYFAPNDFLGRTELSLQEIMIDKGKQHGPVEKRLKLMGVNFGELVLKLDLAVFRDD